jgi:hypothetical protein
MAESDKGQDDPLATGQEPGLPPSPPEPPVWKPVEVAAWQPVKALDYRWGDDHASI